MWLKAKIIKIVFEKMVTYCAVVALSFSAKRKT